MRLVSSKSIRNSGSEDLLSALPWVSLTFKFRELQLKKKRINRIKTVLEQMDVNNISIPSSGSSGCTLPRQGCMYVKAHNPEIVSEICLLCRKPTMFGKHSVRSHQSGAIYSRLNIMTWELKYSKDLMFSQFNSSTISISPTNCLFYFWHIVS